MPKTVKGLTVDQFRTLNAEDYVPEIERSSHETHLLVLNTEDASTQLFIEKSYAPPTDTVSAIAQSTTSMICGLSTSMSSFFSSAQIKDPNKECCLHELSGQLESFYSAMYRLLLHSHAAETYALFNEGGICVGSVSRCISGFKSAHENTIAIEQHKKGFARMLAASYILQEDDLHKRNYGINENNDICRIDFDMSGWPETENVKGPRSGMFHSAKSSFKLSAKDIINLPVLEVATPFYWPTSSFYFFSDAKNFSNLKDDLDFNYQKYLTLLQFCLLSDSYLRKLGTLYIEDKYAVERAAHVHNLIERKKELLTLLTQLPAFSCLIHNTGIFEKVGSSALDEMTQAYTRYNATVESTLNFDACELIPIELIETRFEQIKAQTPKLQPKVQTFNRRDYERYEVPEALMVQYRERKRYVLAKLVQRFKELEQEHSNSNEGLFASLTVRDKAHSFFDHHVRGQNIKQMKIEWLKEVIENAKDDNKVIMEWFQTSRTPFHPILINGRTGQLIESIKNEENHFVAERERSFQSQQGAHTAALS